MSSRGRGKRGQTGTYQQVKRQRNDIQNKKPCNLGKSCPYQHEYQHRLEFSHDQEPSSSSGNRLFPNSNGGSSTISFQGKGTRLGGNPLLPPIADEVAWLDTAATMQHYPPEDDAIEAVNANLVADATIASLCSPCSYAVCEICKLPVELKELDKHCAQHEQRGDYLRLRQEEEYEASLIADAKRLAKKQQDEVDAAEAARKQREEEDARAAVEVSLQERWKADMEKAKFDLLPEPSLENKSKNDAESIFSIRFTMPNGSRLVRRFNSNFPLKDAFNFIRANYEVQDQKVILRTASTQGPGVFHIEDSDLRTFAEIGMTANTSLIIALEDKEEGSPQPTATVLQPKAHESPSSIVVIDIENDSPRSEQVLKLPSYAREAKKATGANSEDIIWMSSNKNVASSGISSSNSNCNSSVGSVDVPSSGHSLRRRRRKQHDSGLNRVQHAGDVIDLT